MPGSGHREAGGFEVWAARAWNVFNEGRPFSVLYPLLVLLAAAPLGLGPEGSLAVALCGALAMAGVLACFTFPLLGAVGGWLLFTIVVWGSVYYPLRTGAPWLNGLRFWRLVLTNSDPTSGNALEQVPKLSMSLSAATLLAEDPGAGSIAAITAAAALAAVLGFVAQRRFATTRMPRYPARAQSAPTRPPLARRVYVIVIDGCNRGRLWQARAPPAPRPAPQGTAYPP